MGCTSLRCCTFRSPLARQQVSRRCSNRVSRHRCAALQCLLSVLLCSHPTCSPTCAYPPIPRPSARQPLSPCRSSLPDCQAHASPLSPWVFPPGCPPRTSQAASLPSAPSSSSSFSICKARFGRIALSNSIPLNQLAANPVLSVLHIQVIVTVVAEAPFFLHLITHNNIKSNLKLQKPRCQRESGRSCPKAVSSPL